MSLRRNKAPKYTFDRILKTKISASEAYIFSSFIAGFHCFSLKFRENDATCYNVTSS